MLDALQRSGYLLESEIADTLARKGFFVESNQVIEDPITGKSREIDLIGSLWEYDKEKTKYNSVAEIHFVFEIKNNLFPVVLLTPFEFSPTIEDWAGLKEVLTIPKSIDYSSFEGFYEDIIEKSRHLIYTQYCSFDKKKANEELMAIHPENIHSGLSKITQYCEEKVLELDELFAQQETKDDYFRHFLFMPVLLINSDLYELRRNKVKKTESAILVYNYYFKKEPKLSYVFVVTKDGFAAFIESMLKIQRGVTERMIKIRYERKRTKRQ